MRVLEYKKNLPVINADWKFAESEIWKGWALKNLCIVVGFLLDFAYHQ